VFAIAITLLVLEIAVPPGFEHDPVAALLSAWPSYLAYLVSFATVGSLWLAHSAVTEHLESADATFLRINLLVLLVVAFVPFPTRLIAEHVTTPNAERVAVIVYGFTLLLASSTVSALWRWARHAGLIRAEATAEDVQYLTRRLQPGVAGYLVIIVVAIFQPLLAVVGYLAIALFFLVPVRSIRASHAADAAGPD
jgi:uncharacterized membrane protein